MRISLAFHIVGLVLWVGGLIILPRIMKGFAGGGATTGEAQAMIPRVFFGYIVPGFAIAIVTGLYQFFEGGGASVYMKQGWFHGKLTFIILLVIATVLLATEVSKTKSGGVLSKGKLGAIHGIAAGSLILITLLTLVGR